MVSISSSTLAQVQKDTCKNNYFSSEEKSLQKCDLNMIVLALSNR